MSSHTVWPNHVTHLLFKSANPCTDIQLELIIINISDQIIKRILLAAWPHDIKLNTLSSDRKMILFLQ